MNHLTCLQAVLSRAEVSTIGFDSKHFALTCVCAGNTQEANAKGSFDQATTLLGWNAGFQWRGWCGFCVCMLCWLTTGFSPSHQNHEKASNYRRIFIPAINRGSCVQLQNTGKDGKEKQCWEVLQGIRGKRFHFLAGAAESTSETFLQPCETGEARYVSTWWPEWSSQQIHGFATNLRKCNWRSGWHRPITARVWRNAIQGNGQAVCAAARAWSGAIPIVTKEEVELETGNKWRRAIRHWNAEGAGRAGIFFLAWAGMDVLKDGRRMRGRSWKIIEEHGRWGNITQDHWKRCAALAPKSGFELRPDLPWSFYLRISKNPLGLDAHASHALSANCWCLDGLWVFSLGSRPAILRLYRSL